MSAASPSRREVIVGAVGTGFALAVRPVSATTVSTEAEGLDAGDVEIPTATGVIPGYRAVATKRKGKAPVVGDKDALRPRHPLDVAGALKAPVLGLYGGQDPGIPLASVEQMRAALAAGDAAAKRSQIHVYPEAGHAFFADYRPSYRAADAADGWTRLLAWFKASGVT